MKKVITYGTFDLFHQGHLKLLQRAKGLGDYLIVGVTTEHFDETRGKLNVIDSTLSRIESVKATGLADEIIIEDHEGQKIEDIQKYNIDVFTVGSDWEGTFDYLRTFCEVVYLDRTPEVSSTMLRNSKFQIVRTGIVGTGRIAPRFIAESKFVSGIQIIGAYNPVVKSGRSFQRRFGIDTAYENYEAFLDKVNAVYIASPNETHYDYAKRALLAGRHVLSEKPVAFTKKETIELYQLAEQRQLVLLEGIKTAYCPGFQQLINVVHSGKIGQVHDVEACFTRLADPASREYADAEYGGAFLEFAAYTFLPIFKLLGLDYRDVRIDSILGENGVDLYTKVQLLYDHGMATAKCGVGVKSEGQLVAAGTKGYLLAESPWWLTKKFTVRYEETARMETYEPNFQGDGLRYEISEFVSQINGTCRNGYKLTKEEAVAMAEITELFMRKRQELTTRQHLKIV